MSLSRIVLALLCFAIGFYFAGATGSDSSPVAMLVLILGTISISMIVRYFMNKRK